MHIMQIRFVFACPSSGKLRLDSMAGNHSLRPDQATSSRRLHRGAARLYLQLI